MKTPQVMIIGFGDLARRMRPKLAGIAQVIGVSRRPEMMPDSLAQRVYGDYTVEETLSEAAALAPEFVVFTPTPASRDVRGYQEGYAQAAQHIVQSGLLASSRRAFYVSSTRVYAEQSGGWVTEDSPLAAGDPYVDALLEGEACFRRHATATILRPSGLYDGAKPIMLRPLLEGFASRCESRYTNRIHRNDVAQILVDSIKRDLDGRVLPSTLNLNDDEPVTTKELEAWCFAALER